jgi:hypothetical protein
LRYYLYAYLHLFPYIFPRGLSRRFDFGAVIAARGVRSFLLHLVLLHYDVALSWFTFTFLRLRGSRFPAWRAADRLAVRPYSAVECK